MDVKNLSAGGPLFRPDGLGAARSLARAVASEKQGDRAANQAGMPLAGDRIERSEPLAKLLAEMKASLAREPDAPAADVEAARRELFASPAAYQRALRGAAEGLLAGSPFLDRS